MSVNSSDPNAHRATRPGKHGAMPSAPGRTPPAKRGATARAARSTPRVGNPRLTPAPPTPTTRAATSPTGRDITSYHAPLAWIGDAVAEDVLIEVIDGRFASVTP